MTSESTVFGRRNTALAAVIGSVLATCAGSASALEFESDGGVRVNWNTTISIGSSWRAEDPSQRLYTLGDAALTGQFTGPYIPSTTPPGTYLAPNNGTAGNWAAGEATLNYEKGDRFSTPFKLLSDVEVKYRNFGALVRFKAWYDQALNDEEVRVGHQNNNMNGTRVLGPTAPNCVPTSPLTCIPISSPGVNRWPTAKLSDDGFEDEQKFDNIMLLDAYVYGSFPIGNTDLQLRLGNQVVNWGESVFIQGVNQINPIDVPAARRAGAELKEILLPVWMAYANWGLPFGSIEAFYQFKWDNTSIDGCGTYWSVTSSIISTRAGNCNSATAFGSVLGSALAQTGSAAWYQANGLYVPLIDGKEASDSGQFGLAFRFPVDAIDTEFGLYAMNIHSRLPVISSKAGTSPADLTAQQLAVLSGQIPGVPASCNIIGQDAAGYFYRVGTTNIRAPIPLHQFTAANCGVGVLGAPINLTPSGSYWEYIEDIQIYGLSAATNIGGWSVSAEYSYQKDVPAQINGNDLLLGGFLLAGPNRAASFATYLEGTGGYLQGYNLFDKQQFQVNTVKTFSNVIGADNLLLVGEIGMQWNDVPDHLKDEIRYGRGFMWGYASSPSYGISVPATGGTTCLPNFQNAPTVPAGTLYNPSPRGCDNNGFVTDTAWGYRVRASADYLNVFNSGITVTPSVYWAHDVDGITIDPAFIENRQVLGVGVKFTYNKQYVFDLNWVSYADEGYDPLQDRDYYSASVSVTF